MMPTDRQAQYAARAGIPTGGSIYAPTGAQNLAGVSQVVGSAYGGQGGNVWPSGDVLDYLSSIYGYDITAGLGTMTNQRLLEEFNQNLEFLYEDSMRKHDQAISVAQIYGAAQAQAAAEGRAGDEARARATGGSRADRSQRGS